MRRFLLVTLMTLTGALVVASSIAVAADLHGTDGRDRLVGTDNKDRIAGAGARDDIFGKRAPTGSAAALRATRSLGGRGDDRIFGDSGRRDEPRGGEADDYLNTDDNRGFDIVHGGPGFDSCNVDVGEDSAHGCEFVG